ncbi:type I-E CRISPR-associated protein Cas5/CasD [Gordonia sputi]|nr:type I-E CRISPR-associated protein Cas5/CasD [Gordonia sputi]
MQSWGASSRFARRDTRLEPTKSGVIGLLGSAQGVRRTDSIEHLLGLKFGVRVDQEGSLEKDNVTSRSLDGTRAMPLADKYYLVDAVFVAAVEGDDELVDSLAAAIRRPVFPLYLGRRAYPPSRPVYLATTSTSLREALRDTEWQASLRHRRRQGKSVRLRTMLDSESGSGEVIRDMPMSFDPRRREYGVRNVEESYVDVDNLLGRADVHDPMAFFGGA